MPKAQISDLDTFIGRRLKQLRQEHPSKPTIDQVALFTESTQQQLGRYERGTNKLSASQLYKIAYYLGYPVSAFFLGYKPKDPLPQINESIDPHTTAMKDELEIVASRWPKLNPNQREAILKLLDFY